jgi:hypothetical protein
MNSIVVGKCLISTSMAYLQQEGILIDARRSGAPQSQFIPSLDAPDRAFAAARDTERNDCSSASTSSDDSCNHDNRQLDINNPNKQSDNIQRHRVIILAMGFDDSSASDQHRSEPCGDRCRCCSGQ